LSHKLEVGIGERRSLASHYTLTIAYISLKALFRAPDPTQLNSTQLAVELS